MKNVFKAFGIIALIAAVGFSIITCDNDGDGGINEGNMGDNPPENWPEKDRWAWKWDESSTAKIDYFVDDDGVCTITVSGAPESEIDAGKAHVAYMHTQKEGKSYVYTFQAWTESGDRNLHFQYFENNDDEIWLVQIIPITNIRTTYTIYGDVLSRIGEYPALRIRCANQLGTFYIKMINIREYKPESIESGTLTITNFSGNPGLTANKDAYGEVCNDIRLIFADKVRFVGGELIIDSIQVTGNTLTIPVWEVNENKKISVPYKGYTTVDAGNLYFSQDDIYTNKFPITFKNGCATIDFVSQMEKY